MEGILEIPDAEVLAALEKASDNASGENGIILVKAKNKIEPAIRQLCNLLRRTIDYFDKLAACLEYIFSEVQPKYGVAILFSRREP